MNKLILLAAVAGLSAGAAVAQTADPATANPSGSMSATPDASAPAAAPAPTVTAMAPAPDGMTMENGQWMKDGKAASKADIKAHKKWMAENGVSMSGTPN